MWFRYWCGFTNRDILIKVYTKITELERKMSDLQVAVADLKTSVEEIGVRISAGTAPLEAALAKAVQDLSDFTSADNVEDADYQAQIDTLTTSLAASLADAQAAVVDIQSSTSDLNLLAQPPVG